MILLGCVTSSIKTAIELAAVLSRSSVPVNIRTALTSVNELQENIAPFEILVIANQETARNIESRMDENTEFVSLSHKRIDINSTMSWLKSNRTYRYWYVLEETTKNSPASIVASINTMLDKLKDTAITTACHYQWRNTQRKDFNATNSYQDSLVQCTQQHFSSDENALLQLDSAIDKLDIGNFKHLCVVRSNGDKIEDYTDDDWITAIRGTERFGLIVGPIETGKHLPALLRVRGWLNSSLQQSIAETTRDYPILITNDISTMVVSSTDTLQLKDLPSTLKDISSNPTLLVTALKNDSVSVALLQNNTTDRNLLTVNAAKISDNHPLRQVFTVE